MTDPADLAMLQQRNRELEAQVQARDATIVALERRLLAMIERVNAAISVERYEPTESTNG